MVDVKRCFSNSLDISILRLLLQYQRKYEAAEEIYRRALEGSKKALGKEHPQHADQRILPAFPSPSTATVQSYFGNVSTASGGYQYILGPEHPATVACLEHYSSLIQEIQYG